MATLMKMENVTVIEDEHRLLESKTIKINETHLWCEPLMNDQEVKEVKGHLLKLEIPFVRAKFDMTVDGYGPEDQRLARATGLFVRKSDLFSGEE